MARFKNQVSKGLEIEPETNNHFLETRNQKPETEDQAMETRNQKLEAGSQELETGKDKPETRNQETEAPLGFSESDMEPVNVAGFKVPYVVREHWKKACRQRRVKLSPMLKEILISEFGLPPGLTSEDL